MRTIRLNLKSNIFPTEPSRISKHEVDKVASAQHHSGVALHFYLVRL